MNFEQLFQMQKALDKHIEEKHQLEHEDLVDRKILALLVELGELANETRCFKFWSVKPSSARETILEEFVDGIHFILSLGIECGFESISLNEIESLRADSVTDQFLQIYQAVNEFKIKRSLDCYLNLFNTYLLLADQLQFSANEIEAAYIQKNEVNYDRQQEGY
ncbi:dUTP diphosphatase [Neobacillus sp. PS3-34]|uniref:dUTP diphosphatase n=1 Tax=Neobacillus sp. PS3-34 TaxID=3070678 RepID=UPI0027DEAF28|nr:dUTP diphosphatase [Neobacillus sp. PS3-34]WML47327.1 dUTP diphosphatase [Neobacillus sp. PS3-34]